MFRVKAEKGIYWRYYGLIGLEIVNALHNLRKVSQKTKAGQIPPSPEIPSQGLVGWDLGFVGLLEIVGLSLINSKCYISENLNW